MKPKRALRQLCKWLEKQPPIWYLRALRARHCRLQLIENKGLSGASERLLTEA
jgi:hypothetical protein